MDKLLLIYWIERIDKQGGYFIKEQKTSEIYHIEREFLSLYSTTEFICRLIRSHITSAAKPIEKNAESAYKHADF